MGSRQPTLLLTGFEPFDSLDRNPSQEIVTELQGHVIGDFRVEAAVLPVSAQRVEGVLCDAIERTEPDLVLSLGLAGSRPSLSLERVAINVLDFDSADNDGAKLVDQPVVPDGPNAYFATIPIRRILESWTERGIPGSISNTAGTYICNQVLYLALHHAPRRGYRAGFIHLPFMPSQTVGEKSDQPSMALDLMVRGITLAIEACGAPVPA